MLKKLKMLFLMLCTLLISPVIVEASEQDNISSNSQLTFDVEGDLSVGEIITLTVNIQGIKELYGASLDFRFDSEQLEVLELSGGNLLSEQFITPVNQINQNSASIVITESGNKVNMISEGILFKVKLKILDINELTLKPTSSNNEYRDENANMLIKLSNKNALPIGYDAKEITYHISPNKELTFDEIKVDKVSPQKVGTTIKVTPEVNGGTGDLQYKYWIYGDGKWTVVKDFSDSSNYEWTPTKAGDYKIWVDVKDSSGKMVSKEINYSITDTTLTLSDIKVDKVSPQKVGTTIKVTPEVNGGTGDLQYKYWIYGDGKWTVVKDFSDSSSYEWTPTKAGDYKIWIDVKDSSGKMVSKEINYSITDTTLTLSDIKVDKVSPQKVGTTIKVTPEVNGGTGDLQYKYWIYGDGKWTVVKDFSDSSSYEWTPTKAGDYKIWIDVKDSSGKMVSKEINYSITDTTLTLN